PEGIVDMQRNWIGRSEGAAVTVEHADSNENVKVFMTRPDTLFGSTYCVLAPQPTLVETIVIKDQQEAVKQYKEDVKNKSDIERSDVSKEKTGVFTGAYAINPANNEKVPVWIADYVMMSYGSGAIMAVPGHDERDYEFATKFDLPIKEVVQGG